MTKQLPAILAFLAISIINRAQPSFPPPGALYNDLAIPRIDILVNPDSLVYLYEHPDSDAEYPAVFVFSDGQLNDTLADVGFSLRGNTSRYAAKKSFQAGFNTFDKGRKYHGVEKINLNGEHNDPSVIRAKLCWDLLRRFGVPAPRSNHVRLYINGNYHGLYISVEHIDEEFVLSRFGNQDGNLFKCLYPADLVYLGNDPSFYQTEVFGRRPYDLKTNKLQDDYTDLAHFIDVLNNTPAQDLACELAKVFNLDDYLKILAFDLIVADWDGYVFNKNNYYLYHNTATGKFEYIPYDLDNTFGIDWFSIDWGTRYLYDWDPDEPRPLYTRIINTPELKDKLSFYINMLIGGIMDPVAFYPHIDSLRDMIAPFVQTDPFYPLDYGYTYDDFLLSYDQPLGAHVTYGLKQYIETRIASAHGQLVAGNISPVVKYIRHNYPGLNHPLIIRAMVEDEDAFPEVKLKYRVDNGPMQGEVMLDDGLHNDGTAGDLVYGAVLPALLNPAIVTFQVEATDGEQNVSLLPCDPVEVQVTSSTTSQLYINEFMASNANTIADEWGEYDDWVEIYNGGSSPVWLGDKFLTDNLGNTSKWQLPDVTMNPGQFVLIWADGDTDQGDHHASFKLSAAGEELGIFDSQSTGFAPIDTLDYGGQPTDVSYGRETDGSPVWISFTLPTPGQSNSPGSVNPEAVAGNTYRVYPNPVADGKLYFDKKASYRIYTLEGELLLDSPAPAACADVSSLGKGVYIIRLDKVCCMKFIRP
jgi:hypothetical protein